MNLKKMFCKTIIMKNNLKYLAGLLLTGYIAISCQGNNSSSDAAKDTSMAATKDNTSNPAMDTSGANKMMSDSKKDTLPMKITQVKPGSKHARILIVLPKLQSNAAMTADNEGVYSNVDVWPSFPGGQKAMEDFFTSNVEYPQQAADNNTEGVVNVNFVVDEKGKVLSPKIVGNKPGNGLEDEALRIVNIMPNWTPGKIKGKNVKTRFTLPVRFQLES